MRVQARDEQSTDRPYANVGVERLWSWVLIIMSHDLQGGRNLNLRQIIRINIAIAMQLGLGCSQPQHTTKFGVTDVAGKW